jgi:deoxyribodipyrimidine photo-lyase
VSDTPTLRIRTLTSAQITRDGSYVLYWMTASRRLAWNYALDRAIQIASATERPLLILEAVSASYRWASDRHHQAIIDGMVEHRADSDSLPLGYYPYVEPYPGAGEGLLEALASRAVAVVTDDSPVFFTPELIRAASRLSGVRVEAVDSCGLLPLRAPGRSFSAAYHFRRYLQKELPVHLAETPSPAPFTDTRIPPFTVELDAVESRWPSASASGLLERGALSTLAIDHTISPSGWQGGTRPATAALDDFVERGIGAYPDRNHPDLDVTSGLSPWLHYGHISAHEVFEAVASRERWNPLRLSTIADGRRKGWWGVSEAAEAFLDQLVTWRELGYGFAVHEPEYRRYEALPGWARGTLEDHVSDPRAYSYTLAQFTAAETHDELWNAAQRQLVRDGRIHNYLRMLWGKKILEWTEHPREALDVMVELNNRYALDGRDPNSYSGIFWVMGRFDRGWPERPIFGKVRSMTSKSTRRKVTLDRYLDTWSDG